MHFCCEACNLAPLSRYLGVMEFDYSTFSPSSVCPSDGQKRRHPQRKSPFFPADPAAAQQTPPVAQKRTPAPSIESLRSSDAAAQRGPPRPFSRTSSVKTSTSALASSSRDTSRPPSTVENHLDYLREPVVKTPTEPTRVKSPEGSVRSPDPINWTVPLDTGKTFSVTQSLKDGGGDRNRAKVTKNH